MQEEKINLRLKNILQRMCSENGYITVTAIARDLGVSSRTILRELPSVEKWLVKYGCKLDTKAGVGIRIHGTAEDRNNIIRQLGKEKEEKVYTPRERQIIIAAELLQNKEPVKLYSFTCILNVAEGTISNDLDKLEEWLEKYALVLVRKQGVGVYIEGNEDNKRKCMINMIYENINQEYLVGLIRNNISQNALPVSDTELMARSRLLNLVNDTTIHQLENLVHQAEVQIGNRLADSAFVGLIVHLAIAIQRIKKNEDITMDRKFMEELRNSKEYTVAERLARTIEELFGLEIPEDEIGYITMHIKGSRSIETDDEDNQKSLDRDDLVSLSKEIIRIAENETGKFLSQSEKLLSGLVNHLGPAISRLKMNMEIRNPLLAQIKAHYPELLKVAGKCAEVMEQHIGMKIPEAEVAYIALHLGAAIEKIETTQKRKYKAAIACATGIGTSRLLATRIEREYDNIQIADVVSTLRIDEEWLRNKGIEFIISTIGIEECPVPVAVVNPLLFDEDKSKVSALISRLKNEAPIQPIEKRKNLGLRDKMQILNLYGKAITEILDNFFMIEDSQAADINDLVSEVSHRIAISHEDAERLENALRTREAKGGTFISDYGILLLHCRTEITELLHFGTVKMRNEIYYGSGRAEQDKVKLGIVVVAPEECSKYLLETISHVNGMLIEDPRFTWLMQNGTKDEVMDELSNILESFFNTQSARYLL